MMNEHKVVLDRTKEKFNELKKTMHELRAAEVSTFTSAKYVFILQYTFHYDNDRFGLLIPVNYTWHLCVQNSSKQKKR
jgi:hypothetical protein